MRVSNVLDHTPLYPCYSVVMYTRCIGLYSIFQECSHACAHVLYSDIQMYDVYRWHLVAWLDSVLLRWHLVWLLV